MSSYKHFTLEERKCLQEFLSEGYSLRKIAGFLERDVSSVSREIRRNHSQKPKKKPDNPYHYHAWRAQTLATIRKREKNSRGLDPQSAEWAYIVEKLNLFWSPEQIAYRWRKEHPDGRKFGVSTIYRHIKAKDFDGITRKTHLRRHGKKKWEKNAKYNAIQPDRLIPQWPDEIRLRERVGDWEGDTVHGGVGKGALLTQVDRKSRFLRAVLLPSFDSSVTKDAVVNMMRGFPVHSLSFDNGSEFALFHDMETELHTLVYFAEPHKPWQRGTNENTNDLLRFFFPKGFDFRTVSQSDVDFVVDLINHRPRKSLDWLSPAEVFSSLSSSFSVALT